MNPDEAILKEIINILEKDLNQLKEIITQRKLDRQSLDKAFFLTQEIQVYLYKLFSMST